MYVDCAVVIVCVEVWQFICTMMTTVFLCTHVHIAARLHVLLADRVWCLLLVA